jgi:hypothetical protein
LGLGNPECKFQVSKNWRSHVLKIMSKKFPGLGLGNPHRVCPKTEISRLQNHVLKNSMSRFWWTPPQCKQTPGGQKLKQLRTPQGTGNDWKNLPGTAHIDRHCCFNIYDGPLTSLYVQENKCVYFHSSISCQSLSF